MKIDIQKDEAFELEFSKTNFYKGMVESLKNKDCPFESVFEIRNGKYRSSYVQLSHEIWQARAKAQAVPDTYTPIVLALEDVQSKIAKTSFLTMDEENENEVMAVNANELAAYIDELIEAQESK